jgi:hypothetical protein
MSSQSARTLRSKKNEVPVPTAVAIFKVRAKFLNSATSRSNYFMVVEAGYDDGSENPR